MTIRISSDELNLLIYQYLLETGLEHTAFTLRSESPLPIENRVPPGALMSFLEKALILEELRSHTNEEVSYKQALLKFGVPKCTQDFRLLQPHACRYDDHEPPRLYIPNGCEKTNGPESYTLKGHHGTIFHVRCRQQIILTGGSDNTIRIWSCAQFLDDSSLIAVLPHVSHIAKVTNIRTLDCSPEGFIASAASDGVARIWDPSGRILHVLCEQPGIYSCIWNRTGSLLLTLDESFIAAIWTLEGTLYRQFIHRYHIDHAHWKDHEEFATATQYGEVIVWRVGNYEPVMILQEKGTQIVSLQWNSAGSRLAWLSKEMLFVWESTEPLFTVLVDKACHMEWNPSEPLLVTCTEQGNTQIWDLDKRSLLHSFQAHSLSIICIRHRADGEFFITCSKDNTVRIWRAREGTLVTNINTQGTPQDLAWSSEGTRLVIAVQDKLTLYEL